MGLSEAKRYATVKAPQAPLQKEELTNYLNALTVESLKNIYRFALQKPVPVGPKSMLVDLLGGHFDFAAEGQFREWFFALPDITQHILYRGAFTDYLPIPFLERELGMSLVEKKKTYWNFEWVFKPGFNLGIFSIQVSYGCPLVFVPRFMQMILGTWLVPPAVASLPDCRAADQGKGYDNSVLISDSFPLLCDALRSAIREMEDGGPGKAARSGFKKREINDLRASTGFLPFGAEFEHAPSSVDMLARFVMCMHNYKLSRPEDGQEAVRNLVQAFFSEKSQYSKGWYFPDRAFLEYNVCIDHLSRSAGHFIENNYMPAPRKVFHEILLDIARDGGWFDAGKLAEYIRAARKDYLLFDKNIEASLKIRAEDFEFDGLTLTAGYDEFHPDGIMRYFLLVRPVFKAYCYIFAALGLLEITQETPPLVRNYKKKRHPFSMYDSLKAVRVTEFGRWCLGLTDKRPPKPSQEYQAIADRELLLVTVQGNSLERQVYLDKVGKRLGENRWRISPASFIAGCANERQLAERIERFKMLIDKNPAPHWGQLFKKVIDRAGLFNAKRFDMVVYDLPESREIQEELLSDPEIKRVVRRVEGRMVAVAAKDQSKFFALLGEHGIARFG